MKIERPTLIVHTTYFPVTGGPDDPEREAARQLGDELYSWLTRPPEDPVAYGAGVPVRVATRHDLVDVDEAERVVVIPVLGARAFRDEAVRGRVLAQLEEWAGTAARLLPVPRSRVWRNAERKLPVKQMLTELYAPGDARLATLGEVVLGLARVLRGAGEPGPRLFISHAKADLERTQKAAEKILTYVETNTTGRAFFDRVSLLAGESLEDQIDDHAGEGIFLSVRSDAYSSRSWCQRELLAAKARRLPTLSLEMLTEGEARSHPYGGNGPTMVWPRDDEHAAARVVLRAMIEGVRADLFHAEAERVRAHADLKTVIPFSRPPELLDVAALREEHPGSVVLLHPDPELSVHERKVLRASHPRMKLVTPTTVFRRVLGKAGSAPLAGWQVGLSLSDSPDVDGPQGTTQHHVHDAIAFLARSLISVGAAIAYGGDFRRSGFTLLLIQLIDAYNETAREEADILHSYLGAPLDPEGGGDLAFTSHHLGSGSTAAEALLEPPPPGAPWPPPHRAALYFSDMRRVMARHVEAQIVLGGGAEPKDPATGRKGYGGRYPGVVEEAWRTLEAGRPLYVAGGFGGAAGLVAEVLTGDEDPERLREETWNGEAWFRELTAALDADPDTERLGLPATMADLAAAIRRLAAPLLASDDAARAWNGLSVEENRTLFTSRDPLTISSLVLEGLLEVAAARAQGTLQVELVRGSLTKAAELEVVVIPTFADLELSGAGEALDRVTGGAATRAHELGGPVEIRSEGVDADYVYTADLGEMNEALEQLPDHVAAAAANTAAMARRNGFSRLGLVTFGGNTAKQLEDVVHPMLEGLRAAAETTRIDWFERDEERFETLRQILEAADGVTVSTRVAPAVAAAPPATDETILAVQREGDSLDVAVLVPKGNGLAPSHKAVFGADRQDQLAGGPTKATPPPPDLAVRGRTVAEMLLGEEGARRVLGEFRESTFTVVHDVESSGVPYEALAAEIASQKIVRPALAGGVVRRLRVRGVTAEKGLRQPPRAGELCVLLVVNPTGDLPGAEAEGTMVRRQLRKMSVIPKQLEGKKATVQAVVDALASEAVDVLHYCGHGFFYGPEKHESGLNCADGPLTLDALLDLDHVPRLAFVNACETGRVRAQKQQTHEAQAFAEFFLRAGVDAYLGTFWQVSDAGATIFAKRVYAAIAKGKTIAEAVVDGRRALERAGNPDWANYLLYGDGRFSLVRASF